MSVDPSSLQSSFPSQWLKASMGGDSQRQCDDLRSWC